MTLNVRLMLLALLFTCNMAWAAVIGHVEARGGTVSLVATDGTSRSAAVQALVKTGDLVTTGANGWVVLSMVDHASLTLKPNSQMRLADYAYVPQQQQRSNILISLLQGALRSITGLIGHSTPTAYRINTPTATIGIRGTDHEVLVVTQTQPDGLSAGTYDYVYDGRTVMRSSGTELELGAGETGAATAGAAPRRLEKRPAAFDRLEQFDRDHGISKVLDRLHERSGQGYTLPKALLAAAAKASSASRAGQSPGQAGGATPTGGETSTTGSTHTTAPTATDNASSNNASSSSASSGGTSSGSISAKAAKAQSPGADTPNPGPTPPPKAPIRPHPFHHRL